MADKAISELTGANQVTPTDLFVLEQSGTAKKLTGQVLENWLVSFADGHGGIHSIDKISASGLVDTYRITLADTTTVDFTVTNGRAISEISQTSVSGLTRTYWISFNDGTSESFSVTDGRSITGFEKTGTSGLTDTYTLTYNDGTTGTISVANGRSVDGISKTSTSGLVDTYTIEYNDGTTSQFTVTNGKKGDKGDNTYTWIKYASQEPTEASHSMGDIPDDWRGEYNGPLSSAPADWKQYKWYKIKGDKGDKGDAATLVSKSVTYQAGDSGTIIPSGSWGSSVPLVAQGKYLWTKTELQFNSGAQIVSYSVARMGMDGSGSVSSVNNVSPGENGNVMLNAENVGALPSTGGYMTGELRMNGQAITGLNSPVDANDAVNKAYADQKYSPENKPAPADIGAAPGGYGWGETNALSAPYGNPDNIDRTCTFVASQGNIPAAGVWIGQCVVSYPDVDMTVRALTGAVGSICKRYKLDSVWQPWEWENPPMEPGVEYRTTERWKGKPVYTQLVHFEALPNSERKTVYFNVSGSVDDIVDLDLEVYRANIFYTAGIKEIEQYYATSDRRIVIVTNTDASSFTAVAKVKYTKT